MKDRQAGAAEELPVSKFEGFIGQGFEDDRRAAVKMLQDRGKQVQLGLADGFGDHGDAAGSAVGCRPGLSPDQRFGFFERDLLPPVIRFQLGHPQPVRIVEPLQGRLATHAQGSPVDRMQGIALQLDDASFTVFGQYAAAGRTLAASGGIPGGLAGDHIFVGPDHGEQIVFGFGGAAGGNGDAAHGCNLEKCSAIHA